MSKKWEILKKEIKEKIFIDNLNNNTFNANGNVVLKMMEDIENTTKGDISILNTLLSTLNEIQEIERELMIEAYSKEEYGYHKGRMKLAAELKAQLLAK